MHSLPRLRVQMVRDYFRRLRQYFRQKRYKQIGDLLRLHSSKNFILDLGGGPASFFSAVFPQPERVILLDSDYRLALQAKRQRSSLHVVVGDGERLPLVDQSIETTVCNSVIEHVKRPDQLAIEIRRVSRAYFVQTPNGAFPVETHSFIAIPFYRWVPWKWLRKFLCQVLGASFDYVSSVHYLSEKQLRELFPDATLVYEKVLVWVKSFYVYATNAADIVDKEAKEK